MSSRPLVRRAQRRAASLIRAFALIALVASSLVPVSAATAAEPTDMVLEWNAIAVTTVHNAPTATPPGLGQAPPATGLLLAIVHAAVYDAVNSIDRGHEPYLGWISAPAGASEAAAAATAAHHALVGLTPSSMPQVVASLDALYASSLSRIPDGQSETDGISVGAAAAAAILANRANDGRANTTRTYPTGTEPGQWRLVPPGNGNAFSWVGDVRPFAIKSSDQFPTEGPPALDSDQYAAEFNEVKALGAQTGSSRSEAQQALATFIVANPLPLVNRAYRELSMEHGLTTAEQARLFALGEIASADSFIACFDNKNEHLFWRPQTAIRLAADDGNPATVADEGWLSQFPTPPYPDNPSGYNCYAAAMMHSAKAFFGTDRVAFDLKGSTTRHYTRFTDYVRDAIDGRILTGFHFRSADVQGAWLGKKAAQWVDKHFFGPVE